jgi:nucleotide-binding universal stress UspA family protein
MVAAPRRGGPDAEALRALDRLRHGAVGHDRPHAVAAVDRDRPGHASLDRNRRRGLDEAGAEALHIGRHAGDPVGVDAAQVRRDEALGHDHGVRLRQPLGPEDRGREGIEILGAIARRRIAHGVPRW